MNYNQLLNKPKINNREIIGNIKSSSIGGISVSDFTSELNTELNDYYTKSEIVDLFSRSYVYRTKSGNIVTFNAPANQSIPEIKVDIIAIQSGSGDPSPTNIRPFTGWSAVNRYRTGKNLVFKEIANASISVGGRITSASNNMWVAKVKKGITYTITSDEIFVGGFFTEEPWLDSIAYDNQRIVEDLKTFEAPIDGYVAFRSTSGYSTAQLEVGETATTYEAYNGTTYTTALKDGQGNPLTCYGGQLVNENGVQSLTLTHGYIASYNGETLPSTWISDRDVYAEGTTPTTGAEVVYKLATPQTIPQDNLSIATQEGTNNLWADSGDIQVKCLDKIM